MNASDVLAHLIDRHSWLAAADVARWQIARGRTASKLRVLQHCSERRGCRPEVVLALTLGLVPRARVLPGRRVTVQEGDFVCVHDEPSWLDTNDTALCAALAIWMIENHR